MEKIIDPNTIPTDYMTNCSSCHDVLTKCKYLCITCKAPCANCLSQPKCSISTDTYDFEKYLETLTRKHKFQLKVRTVGTDTCDLESHFDYYKLERTAVIQKSVATDCSDLHYRKFAHKKRTKKYIYNNSGETDLEFTWNSNSDRKTYSRCDTVKRQVNEEETDDLLVPQSEENKENYGDVKNGDEERAKDMGFQDSSSDESDIDLVTSSKVSKCKRIARTYKLTLTQIDGDREKSFMCNACGKTFPKKHLGVLHLGNHVENNKYKCLICEDSPSTLDLLVSHVKDHHRGLVTNNTDNILEEDSEKEQGQTSNSDSMLNVKNYESKQIDKGFQCVLCVNVNDSPSRFPSYKALYLHKRLKHGAKESKARDKTERKPRLKREFICLFCGKEFKSNKALKDHIPVHTGEKNYLCDICNKSYTTSANLHIHKRTHMGLKNFKCTLCDKAFHKKDSLKVHFRKHSGERPFQCDICPMRFDRNFILKNHRLRHFSVKSFICTVCGKAFTTHGGLNNHEKSHKKDPGSKKPRKPAVKPTLDTENAVICDVCGKVYSTKSNLRIHKFVHLGVKPFKCTVCHQSYAKKDSMLTHMRKHTDERPFSCETCGMAFFRNHTLKTHRLRHTGERPHKCNMCGKSFTQSSSLTYHIKHHNKKEEKKKVGFNEDRTKTPRKKKIEGKASKMKNDPDKNVAEIVNEMVVMNDENAPEYTKSNQLMVPVIKKEVLLVDENVTADASKKETREAEVCESEKDSNHFMVNKLNYYITKNHVLPLPKETYKPKIAYRKDDYKNEQLENVVISKNPVTKDANLVMNREIWDKNGKEYQEIGERGVGGAGGVGVVVGGGTGGKPENAFPITGEILNAAFISDENGEVIPFGSMTLQSVNAENIMISPLIKVENGDEGDRKKGLNRGSRLTVIDSKVKYQSPGKPFGKGNCQILNIKDSRMQQRIQLINSEPLSFHIQLPVSCTTVSEEGVLGSIASNGNYYNNV